MRFFLFCEILSFGYLLLSSVLGSDSEEENSQFGRQRQVNFASVSAGAVILESPPKANGYHYLLNDDKDKYGIAPCSEKKWLVIGLSEDIVVEEIVIANYEKFSSSLETFQILSSTSFPASDWIDLGSFVAAPELGEQTFQIEKPTWGRYLKFRFQTHHGDEFYCTLTQIKVHGSTVLENLKREVERSTREGLDLESAILEEDRDEASDLSSHISNEDLYETLVELPPIIAEDSPLEPTNTTMLTTPDDVIGVEELIGDELPIDNEPTNDISLSQPPSNVLSSPNTSIDHSITGVTTVDSIIDNVVFDSLLNNSFINTSIDLDLDLESESSNHNSSDNSSFEEIISPLVLEFEELNFNSSHNLTSELNLTATTHSMNDDDQEVLRSSDDISVQGNDIATAPSTISVNDTTPEVFESPRNNNSVSENSSTVLTPSPAIDDSSNISTSRESDWNHTESSADTHPDVVPSTISKLKACLEQLKFPEFQAKMKAKLAAANSLNLNQSATLSAAELNQDVFRSLMKKISSLEQNSKIFELYLIQISECQTLLSKELEHQRVQEGVRIENSTMQEFNFNKSLEILLTLLQLNNNSPHEDEPQNETLHDPPSDYSKESIWPMEQLEFPLSFDNLLHHCFLHPWELTQPHPHTRISHVCLQLAVTLSFLCCLILLFICCLLVVLILSRRR